MYPQQGLPHSYLVHCARLSPFWGAPQRGVLKGCMCQMPPGPRGSRLGLRWIVICLLRYPVPLLWHGECREIPARRHWCKWRSAFETSILQFFVLRAIYTNSCSAPISPGLKVTGCHLYYVVCRLLDLMYPRMHTYPFLN